MSELARVSVRKRWRVTAPGMPALIFWTKRGARKQRALWEAVLPRGDVTIVRVDRRGRA